MIFKSKEKKNQKKRKRKMPEKFKIVMGYNGADVPTRYYLGKKQVSKIEFAKEMLRRNKI